MEEAKRLETHQNKSEDFIVLEEGDFVKTDVSPPRIAVVISSQSSIDVSFMQKVWSVLLTLHLFMVPALLGLILNQALTIMDYPYDEVYEEIKRHLFVAFMAAAMFIGLPSHILTMADLEDILHEAKLSTIRQNATTQTTEYSVFEGNVSDVEDDSL